MLLQRSTRTRTCMSLDTTNERRRDLVQKMSPVETEPESTRAERDASDQRLF